MPLHCHKYCTCRTLELDQKAHGWNTCCPGCSRWQHIEVKVLRASQIQQQKISKAVIDLIDTLIAISQQVISSLSARAGNRRLEDLTRACQGTEQTSTGCSECKHFHENLLKLGGTQQQASNAVKDQSRS